MALGKKCCSRPEARPGPARLTLTRCKKEPAPRHGVAFARIATVNNLNTQRNSTAHATQCYCSAQATGPDLRRMRRFRNIMERETTTFNAKRFPNLYHSSTCVLLKQLHIFNTLCS